MNIIDGKKIADGILEDLKKQIQKKEIKPCLGIILIGDNPASQLYVQKKKEAAQKIGVNIKEKILSQDILEEEILKVINQFNQDNQINGILVQMPLPRGINSDKIIKAIDLEKDVDGFLPESKFDSPFILAIEKALKATGENLNNKKAIALVNSDVFGKRLVKFFSKRELELKYVILSQQAKDLNGIDSSLMLRMTRDADIIITALGKPGIIKENMIKQDAILIDGGISKKNGKILGDIDKESIKEKAKWLSPVPRGLGPITVAFLLKNLIWNTK